MVKKCAIVKYAERALRHTPGEKQGFAVASATESSLAKHSPARDILIGKVEKLTIMGKIGNNNVIKLEKEMMVSVKFVV